MRKIGKKAKIAEENLHVFWTTCWISMKFSGKMSLKILLKVIINQGFTTLSLENTSIMTNLTNYNGRPKDHINLKFDSEL